jgi:hypothetical protein
VEITDQKVIFKSESDTQFKSAIENGFLTDSTFCESCIDFISELGNFELFPWFQFRTAGRPGSKLLLFLFISLSPMKISKTVFCASVVFSLNGTVQPDCLLHHFNFWLEMRPIAAIVIGHQA